MRQPPCITLHSGCFLLPLSLGYEVLEDGNHASYLIRTDFMLVRRSDWILGDTLHQG